MCGICGAAWTVDAVGPSETEFAEMVERLHHRGPDDSGVFRDAHAALGFRRLSILDLAGGHQPLSNEDGSVWVAFNGEIYNFEALRHRLEARGHTLKSSGDTEVLVHLYEDERENMFSLLRGMFAIAIWDVPRQTLLLGRDRLGQKPLLYQVEPGRICFASELKSLLAAPAQSAPRLDLLAIDQYFTYGYVPHPRSILQGVHKLPPAHYAVWKQGRLHQERYWTPDWNAERVQSVEADRAELREVLTNAVREQMVSEVPLGAFLSGGIDSTIIVGLMQQVASRPVKTFSIGFDDPAFDESAYAELAARQLGTEHHTFRVEPRAWETLPALAETFDEPFADSSALPTWFVSQQTRSHVTVALTGDAGDELFGGYHRYQALGLTCAMEVWSAPVRRHFSQILTRGLPVSSRAKTPLRTFRRLVEKLDLPTQARYLSWMTSWPESYRLALYSDALLEQLAAHGRQVQEEADPAWVFERVWNLSPRRDPATRAMIADMLTYLPGDLLYKVDMASMAHALECRSPFLDHRVVELALALPRNRKLKLRRGQTKLILKQAFADLLPPAIQTRSKMGFSVPLDRWFRGPLAGELREMLLDPGCKIHQLFRLDAITRLIDEHTSGQSDHAYRLWSLLMLELWFKRWGAAVVV